MDKQINTPLGRGLRFLTNLQSIGTAMLLLLLCLGLSSCKKPVGQLSAPELLEVDTTQVVIAWHSELENVGRVMCRPASGGRPTLGEDEFGPSNTHEVVVRGLKPGTRYTYARSGLKEQFSFRTAPQGMTPFSFLLTAGDVSDSMEGWLVSENPDFIFSLTQPVQEKQDTFAAVRSALSVYGPDGISAPFLAEQESQSAASQPWYLDWGGLRLIVLGKGQKTFQFVASEAVHTHGVVLFVDQAGAEPALIEQVHAALTAHNTAHPSTPAAFVLLCGASGEVTLRDGIRYCPLPLSAKKQGFRVDVSVELIRATSLLGEAQLVLREPPLREKRTCAECKRLAEQGAYEESVQAYKDFIAANAGHYQIDDAYFAIAELLDERLFRYKEALTWYRKLENEYPTGSLTPLARQRMKYLKAYGDYDFAPLAQFERIRRVSLARTEEASPEREALLNQVRTLVEQYPDAALASTMLYWLANQYRNTQPDRAVSIYQELAKTYAGKLYADEALLEIGQTYYGARRYHEGRSAFEIALEKLPKRRVEITAQIWRCNRNIRRGHLRWLSLAIFVVVLILAVLVKPFGLRLGRIGYALTGGVLMAVATAGGAWFIHEQFNSMQEMARLIGGFSAAAACGYLLSATLASKVSGKHGVLRFLLATLLGLVLAVAGFYLTLYYVNEHYLVAVFL